MLNPSKTKLERSHLPWSRRSRTVILAMLFLCAVAGGLWLSADSSVRSSPTRPAREDQSLSPFIRINEKARAATEGDSTSIRGLADEIFDAITPSEISDRTRDEMKERIVRSEVVYRSTGSGGVPERNIVRMINNLADKLDLPDYARVDGILVRQTRVKLFTRLPHLFSQAVTREEKGQGGVGSALKTEMSPMEASFLATLLLQQKLINESYQVTPEQGRTNLHNFRMQRWQAFRNFKRSRQKGYLPSEPPKEGFSVGEPSAKSIEMSQALSRARAQMRVSDLLNLSDASLDDLGIAK